MHLIVEEALAGVWVQPAGDSPLHWEALERAAAVGTRTAGWGLAEVPRLRALAEAARRPVVAVERW